MIDTMEKCLVFMVDGWLNRKFIGPEAVFGNKLLAALVILMPRHAEANDIGNLIGKISAPDSNNQLPCAEVVELAPLHLHGWGGTQPGVGSSVKRCFNDAALGAHYPLAGL